MLKPLTAFWKNFHHRDLKKAREEFSALSDADQESVLAELFQKSEYHRKPIMVSVLIRKLQDDKSFNDFYQAWLPTEDMCHPIEVHGQQFQQHFPAPVRAINAVNIHNSKEILSIGITWVNNEDEEKKLWEYVNQANQGDDHNNKIRHNKIKEEAQGELLGLFRVETDDNLGVPFSKNST